MVYYRLTSLRSLERFLHQNLYIAQACGLDVSIPCYRTFARRFKVLEQPTWAAIRQLTGKLVRKHWLRLAIMVTDGSLLAAKGRFPTSGTGEADFRTSDREATWGYSASDDSWVWGYKLHLISTTRSCLVPLTWIVTSAHRQEGSLLASLLEHLRLPKSKRQRVMLGDCAYDSRRNYSACRINRIQLITPLKGNRWDCSHMAVDRKQRLVLYKRWMRRKRFSRLRADIERLLGQLKEVFLLDPLPVKGMHRVKVYVSLVMLSYLAGVAYNGSVHRGLRAIKSLVA